jgi:hypothetical protein
MTYTYSLILGYKFETIMIIHCCKKDSVERITVLSPEPFVLRNKVTPASLMTNPDPANITTPLSLDSTSL